MHFSSLYLALGAHKGAEIMKNEAEEGEKHKIDNNEGISYSDMLKCHQYVIQVGG